jgi:NTE family protein
VHGLRRRPPVDFSCGSDARPTSVAIACQGGGSHAAFTAGVLKVLLTSGEAARYWVRGLSGTSGGAISAALAWYGLLSGGSERSIHLLDGLWRDSSAILPFERALNGYDVWASRLPVTLKTSPYTPPLSTIVEQLRILAQLQRVSPTVGPRREFVDLRALLSKYLDLDSVQAHRGAPRFLVGAVDVLSGEFKTFDSENGEISVETLLASAALPALFRAVPLAGRLYWDGLFSQNPPIREFVSTPQQADEKPDEIWIVQINPQTRDAEPRAPEDIEDRRNELAGNLSLNQEVHFIETINALLAREALEDRERYKPVTVKWIAIDPTMVRSRLDVASKSNRDPAFIQDLIAHGEHQARAFLKRRQPT